MSGSLGIRIFGGIGLVIVLTLIVAGVVFFSLLGGYRRQLDRNTLLNLADQVVFGLTQFAQLGDPQPGEIARYLREQSAETGVLVFVLDREGRVLRDFSPGEELAPAQLPVRLLDVRGAGGRYVEGEFDAGGESVPFLARVVPVDRFGRGAFLAIALPESGAGAVAGDLVPRLLLSGLIGLAVALLVGLAISRSLYRPLQRITGAARAVGAGRYDTRVPEEGPQEMRELARAFNRMTAQVQRHRETLQNFLADVSHELRTPLTSIRGFTEALRDGIVAEEERRQRTLEIIDDEARRMLRLVEDLLDLSKIQAGQLPLRREPVDPAEILTHVAEVFAQRAQDAGLTLEIVIGEALPTIPCDFDRLVQVLANLVDNAIQHTARGGITLRAAAASQGVTLSVEDTGEGIPAEALPRLFDRFYRIARTGPARGSGLGLAIAREIVLAHGGEISAESTMGRGTRFRITMPSTMPAGALPA